MKKDQKFEWTEKQQNAFDRLKNCLINTPILQYPNFDKTFYLYTDVSEIGLGAILAQKDENRREHVIAYASRSLTKAEQNYSVTDQKCLAIIWVIQHFYHYLCISRFKLITDHSALK